MYRKNFDKEAIIARMLLLLWMGLDFISLWLFYPSIKGMIGIPNGFATAIGGVVFLVISGYVILALCIQTYRLSYRIPLWYRLYQFKRRHGIPLTANWPVRK